MVHGLIEMKAKRKMGKGGREGVHGVVEGGAKRKMREGRREVRGRNSFVEFSSKNYFCNCGGIFVCRKSMG